MFSSVLVSILGSLSLDTSSNNLEGVFRLTSSGIGDKIHRKNRILVVKQNGQNSSSFSPDFGGGFLWLKEFKSGVSFFKSEDFF